MIVVDEVSKVKCAENLALSAWLVSRCGRQFKEEQMFQKYFERLYCTHTAFFDVMLLASFFCV